MGHFTEWSGEFLPKYPMLPVKWFPRSLFPRRVFMVLRTPMAKSQALCAIQQFKNICAMIYGISAKRIWHLSSTSMMNFTPPHANCCCLIPHWPNDSPSFLPWVLFNTFPHLNLSLGGRIPCHFIGMDLGGGFSARSMFFFHNPRCSWQTLPQFCIWACVGQHVRYVCAQCIHQSWPIPLPPLPHALVICWVGARAPNYHINLSIHILQT